MIRAPIYEKEMQAGVLPPAPNAANLTRVLAMGANGAGQLGIGTLTAQRQLTSIEYLVGQGAVGVACGGRHSLVLAEQGWVFAFGSNEEGQLGLGATERAPLPQVVPGFSTRRLAQIAAGSVRIAPSKWRGGE